MRIEIHQHEHVDPRVLELLEAVMATLDEILDIVRPLPNRVDGLNALLDGIRGQLADVLSGTVIPPAVQAKIDEVFANAQSASAKIDETIAENTAPAPA